MPLIVVLLPSCVTPLQEAEAYYKRAIEADGNVAAWHINLAVLLNDHKRQDEARVLLQRAVQLAPQDSIAYNNYGWVLRGCDTCLTSD